MGHQPSQKLELMLILSSYHGYLQLVQTLGSAQLPPLSLHEFQVHLFPTLSTEEKEGLIDEQWFDQLLRYPETELLTYWNELMHRQLKTTPQKSLPSISTVLTTASLRSCFL